MCGEAFMVESDLKKHQSSTHETSSVDEAAQCDECGLTVHNEKELNEHKEKEHAKHQRNGFKSNEVVTQTEPNNSNC